ncbi:hypothetical protein [Endozoicomonas sp. 8E]|uniref:hypothetical protein n=1 Tax=Endozoicomonas sp. 8E TaxID=3035692 RepID=UPI00293942B7|nr:hypothetical protein [Endozoicomonas sp. 8E]WOG29621.1 hypothetical protein P6910_08195 [Endozoicomonas sp. 8E]
MTNVRHNALSLSVAVAISSSIIITEALAERRLQIKSVDIDGSEHAEFTQSEVMVQPTLGDDQQPIPKSFTTTYPDEAHDRASQRVHSAGFTEILSDVDGGASSVDVFETGENNVAQRYTKVLKVGDEGVFRFTHNLAEMKLVIEVRKGMIDQDSIAAVLAQSGGIQTQPLEWLTNVASPEQLAGILNGANKRAGNLGEVDNFVALATIEVDKVEVNGRTFMRLIAAGDQPPELQSLGQSLFVNDEALFAAATSAYAQVHIKGESLKQEALSKLLSHQKPIGYVVYVEDDRQACPVPDGYPRMEVSHTPGETIVFHGQKQNPADSAFVDGLYSLYAGDFVNYPNSELTTLVKKNKLKSYQYVIRSRQMTLLEELAEQQHAEPDQDKPAMLAYYEFLQQALTSAAQDQAEEFEFVIGHIRGASSVATPTWMHEQLIKHFSFKPIIRNLLTNQLFIQTIQKVTIILSITNKAQADALGDDEQFASKVKNDIITQLIEVYSKLDKLQIKEFELIRVINRLQITSNKAITSEKEKKLRALQLRQEAEDELSKALKELFRLQDQSRKLQQEVDRIPALKQQFRDAREEARKAYNTELAKDLGIDHWDDSQPLEEQVRLIRQKIHEMNKAVAETGRLRVATAQAKLPTTERQFVLASHEKDDPEVSQRLRKLETLIGEHRLQQKKEQEEELEKHKNYVRRIQYHIGQVPMRKKDVLESVEAARRDHNTQLAEYLGIDNWDNTRPLEEQVRLIRDKLLEINNPDAGTEQPRREAVKEKLAAIEKKLDITPYNENDLDFRFQSIQQYLYQELELANKIRLHELTGFEAEFGLVSDNENDLEARCKAIQQHLKNNEAEIALKQFQQQGIRTDATKEAELKARYATIAAYLTIQDFDSNEDINVQQGRLIQKLKEISTHEESLRQQLKTMSRQIDMEDSYTKARKQALAVVLGIDPSENTGPEDRARLESTVYDKLFELSKLEQELEDSRTPGHPMTRDAVFVTLTNVEKALNMATYPGEHDEYLRRQHISMHMQKYITEATQRSEEKALKILKTLEELLKIEISEEDDKGARLDRVLTRLDRVTIKRNDEDISEYLLNEMDKYLWKDESTSLEAPEGSDIRRDRIRGRLAVKVAASDQRAREKQGKYLLAVEHELNIDPHKNPAAMERERDKAFIAELASDLQVGFEDDVSLSDRQHTLRDIIQELREKEAGETYEDLDDRRAWNNKIAHQLKVEDYKDDTSLDDQSRLINAKLDQLDEEIFLVRQPDVAERIAAIENALDRQMARLPKPRYVLDRELAIARQAVKDAEGELETTNHNLDAIRRKKPLFLRPTDNTPITMEEHEKVFNQAIKKIQIRFGLPADDEQTPEERIDDIRDFLRRNSAVTEDKAIEKLRAATKTLSTANIDSMDEALDKMGAATKTLEIATLSDINLLEVSNYFTAIAIYAITRGRHKTDEVEGELPLTRKKYNLVTRFLREHDRKSLELTNAVVQEDTAQTNLDLRKEQILDSGEIDEQTKTLHEQEIARLNSELMDKKAALSEAAAALSNHHQTILDAIEDAVGLKPEPADTHEQRVNALKNQKLLLGGEDGTGGKIRQLLQEQARLESEVETRQANLERRKEALQTARKAVEMDDGPFQYTPIQAEVRAAIDDFVQQHSLKKQALEAAMGLAQSAVENGREIPCLTRFDFDDEFAPIHLQALVGDELTFAQASRMVEVFKNLKANFPPLRPEKYDPMTVMEELQILVLIARGGMKTGAQQYDDEIYGMGKTAIHFVEHQPGDLKSFSDYFAAHSASGDKIMALLREGLISQVELENYIKAVRGVNGYQTVAEFEHFLGSKHGVNPDLKALVRMLSDKGAEEFIKSALTPVTVTATGPAAMKESVAGMKEYSAAVIANYVLDDIAFDNGRRTAAFLANIQDTLTPYANAAGISESELIKTIHDTLMQAHAAAVEQQLKDYWAKPSAFLVQAVTWYYSSYRPLLATHSVAQANGLSLSNMSFLYLLDLTNRGDYLHRMLTPFQHWLERYAVDPDRTGQYAYHSGIEQISEVGGLAMPLGKAASSVILLRTGSALFARQYNANPHSYRSISRLVPEIVKSMGSRQGVQVPLLHRVTPQKVKTLASATAGLVLGPVATAGSYAHGLLSGFTYAQTFGFALASSLTFDFFMNDNKMLTQWLGGPLGRSLDKINRWIGMGETDNEYVKRTAVASPQRLTETDEAYANRINADDTMYGWTRHENYLQFRERRDRTMKMFGSSWEKYFRENVPKWSFSHPESIPYSYTLGALFDSGTAAPEPPSAAVKAASAGLEVKKFDLDKDKNTRDEL